MADHSQVTSHSGQLSPAVVFLTAGRGPAYTGPQRGDHVSPTLSGMRSVMAGLVLCGRSSVASHTSHTLCYTLNTVSEADKQYGIVGFNVPLDTL